MFMMSDDIHSKIRFSIASDGPLKSKPQTNPNTNYYELANNEANFLDVILWCKKLNICEQFVSDIQNNKSMTVREKFENIIKTIEKNANKIPKEKLKIFENIVKNLLLLDDRNLREYTEQLFYYEHLDKFTVQKTTLPSINNSAVPSYVTRSKNRGVLFFVNMINFPLSSEHKIRHGAEYDKLYMVQLFREYGYKIFYYEDLLANTFWELTNRLIHQNLQDTDVLIFALASHGYPLNDDASDDVQFYYDQTLNVNDIVHKFNDLNCSTMRGKPKILLFPFCRGEKFDAGVKSWFFQMDGVSTIQPTFNDLLICYATIRGFASVRDEDFGSWYIEAFCKVLSQHGYKLDIERLLHLVVKEINKMNEKCNKARLSEGKECIFVTPCVVRRDFNKLLFLNPGIHEES